ncbi:hypothetical protein, partial [Serratia marcescens]|uniref:hypothetical protein n=1 Tax=Serratia marcescens TaxID=615 RepID=UPI0011E69A17
MKKRIKRILSFCMIAVLLTASIDSPLEVAAVMAGEEGAVMATPSTATKEKKATKSEADKTKISAPTKERGLKERKATPSAGTMATPSKASISEATGCFIITEPKNAPSWYEKLIHCYRFVDRNGKIQYRIYGTTEPGGEENWYRSDENGDLLEEAAKARPVDLTWEYGHLAPYIYESVEPESCVLFKRLSKNIFGNEDSILNYRLETKLFSNYDGTQYSVLEFYGKNQELEEPIYRYVYGHIVNSSDQQEKWHEIKKAFIVDSPGNLKASISCNKVSMRMASSYTTKSTDLYYAGDGDGSYFFNKYAPGKSYYDEPYFYLNPGDRACIYMNGLKHPGSSNS